ncbi:MAG: hypothetical protein ACJAVK_002950 [Akkermansiaceae bacterium]|jgi:hypothetical protein
MDIGEAEVSPLVCGGQFLVVDAEEVEGGGVEVVDVEGILGHRSASKFAAPDDKGVVENVSLLEVLDQSGGSLVDVLAPGFDAIDDTAVVVPASVVKLNEADTALGHAARHEAIRREGTIGLILGSVKITGRF